MFTIIICTYNPDKKMLERALKSCVSQNGEIEFEIVVVDNNSTPPITEKDLGVFTGRVKPRLVREGSQGLAHARLAGIKNSRYDLIVFVDDDNILADDYLTSLKELFRRHPSVAAWGPGIVYVEYTGHCPLWIQKHYSGLFQQKTVRNTQYGSVPGWPEYYPAGSGLSIKKEVAAEYARQFLNGELSQTGRKGKSLASAEDSQMIWTGVKMGYAAGTSPSLRLTHLIPEQRSNLRYLVKLNYGIAYSYRSALREMFPDMDAQYTSRSFLNDCALAFRCFVRARYNPALAIKMFRIDNSWFRGINDAKPHGA